MKKFLIFLAVVFAFVLVQNVHAFPTEITVVKGANDYAPYEIKSGEGKYSGIYIETVLEVAKKIGVTLNIVEKPWARCQKMMEEGAADAILTPFKTPEREGYMYFADEPIAYEETVLFTYTGSGVVYSGDLESLKNYKIGTARGYAYGDAWDKIDFPNKQVVDKQNSLIKMLSAKRIDVTLGTRYILQYLAKKEGVSDQIKALEPPLSKDGGYIAFSKAKGESHKELADAFAKAIKEVKASEKYKYILNKYGIK